MIDALNTKRNIHHTKITYTVNLCVCLIGIEISTHDLLGHITSNDILTFAPDSRCIDLMLAPWRPMTFPTARCGSVSVTVCWFLPEDNRSSTDACMSSLALATQPGRPVMTTTCKKGVGLVVKGFNYYER